MKNVKKGILLILLLLLPCIVSAHELEELKLKWNTTNASTYYDEMYSFKLSDGYLLVTDIKVEKYNFNDKLVGSYEIGKNINVLFGSMLGDELVVAYYKDGDSATLKLIKFDTNLKVLKENSFSGYWDIADEYNVTEDNGKLLVKGNVYLSNLTIDSDLNVVSEDVSKDGSVIKSYYNVSTSSEVIAKYNKDGSVAKTIDVGFSPRVLEIHKFGNKYFVYVLKYDYYKYEQYHYILDENLNIIKKTDREIFSFIPYHYIFVYNDEIYLYTSFIDGYQYYKLDSDYNIVACDSSDPVYTKYDSVYTYLINKYGYDNVVEYDYEYDDNGNTLIAVSLNNSNNSVTFIVLDKNGKEVVNEAFEDSSYDEYNIRYMPCINYNDKYYTFAYFNTSTNRVNVVFFDKTGEELYTLVLDDYGKDIVPCVFDLNNKNLSIALYSTSKTAEATKILYYEMPYDIKVMESVGGRVLSAKFKAGSGEIIAFEVLPKEGYELKEIFVTDTYGNTVVFTDYKFEMPSSDVTIQAIFVLKPSNPDTSDIIIIALIFIFSISLAIIFINGRKFKWLN